MKALILVDIQNDFCPGGALAVNDGDQVVAVANKLMASKQFDLVVATQDWHPQNHGSFASSQNVLPYSLGLLNGIEQTLWPDHCINGSSGAEFHPDLNMDRVTAIFRKGMNSSVDSYSGFFDNDRKSHTGLAGYLASFPIKEVYMMGLATDYCVKFTAFDSVKTTLPSMERKTYLIEDGCRAVNIHSYDGEVAIKDMMSMGIIVTNSDLLTTWG